MNFGDKVYLKTDPDKNPGTITRVWKANGKTSVCVLWHTVISRSWHYETDKLSLL